MEITGGDAVIIYEIYRQRRQHDRRKERAGQLLDWLYNHRSGRTLVGLLVRPGISRAGGWLLDRRWSTCLIDPFVKKSGIDLSCYVNQRYKSYNEFFTREIKPGARPLEGGEGTLISPCDGKLSVYPITAEEGRRAGSVSKTPSIRWDRCCAP